MKYIVYHTINIDNQKIYVGVHKTNSEKFDGYLGCGVFSTKPSSYMNPKTAFQSAVKKHGPKKFIRTTIASFDNENEAYDLEKIIVSNDFLKRSDVYNVMTGGYCGNASSQIKEIHQYDLQGNYLKTFDTVNDAGREYGASNGSGICRAIKRDGSYKGFQWSYIKVDFMKEYEKKEETYNQKHILQYDLEMNLIKEWVSFNACAKEFSNIKKVLDNKRVQTKGFIFKYKE